MSEKELQETVNALREVAKLLVREFCYTLELQMASKAYNCLAFEIERLEKLQGI